MFFYLYRKRIPLMKIVNPHKVRETRRRKILLMKIVMEMMTSRKGQKKQMRRAMMGTQLSYQVT